MPTGGSNNSTKKAKSSRIVVEDHEELTPAGAFRKYDNELMTVQTYWGTHVGAR